MPEANTVTRTKGILKTLKRKYKEQEKIETESITDCLAIAILSRETSLALARSAISELKKTFVDWNEVRIARWGEIERAIRPIIGEEASGEAARQLLYGLYDMFQRHGHVDLDTLAATKPPSELKQFMLSLDFLARNEIDMILLVGLGEAVMPFDEDTLRLSKRLGVLTNTATRAQGQKLFENSFEADDFSMSYFVLREHGRQVCYDDAPNCTQCPVKKDCKFTPRVH